MALLATLWSLLPIPIGMACLFFAWRIPFQERQSIDSNDEILQNSDENLENYFSENDKTPMAQERKKYFVILFSGLGIGAIILGLETFHPVFGTAAKIIFFLTLALSFILHWLDSRKETQDEKNDSSTELDDN